MLDSLLKEAQPLEDKRTVEMGEERTRPTQHALDDDDDVEGDTGDESKLLSRYGVWLMVELCKPRDDIPVVSSHLISLLLSVTDVTMLVVMAHETTSSFVVCDSSLVFLPRLYLLFYSLAASRCFFVNLSSCYYVVFLMKYCS